MKRDLMRQAAAARLVGVRPITVNAAIKNGQLKAYVIAEIPLVSKAEVLALWPHGPRKLSGPGRKADPTRKPDPAHPPDPPRPPDPPTPPEPPRKP